MVRIFQTKSTFSQSYSSQTNETNDFVVTRELQESKVFTLTFFFFSFSRSLKEKSRPCGLGYVYLGRGKGSNTFSFPFLFGFVVLCDLPFHTALKARTTQHMISDAGTKNGHLCC